MREMSEKSGEINWDKLKVQADYAKEVIKAGKTKGSKEKTDEQLREEYLDKKYPNAPRRRR